MPRSRSANTHGMRLATGWVTASAPGRLDVMGGIADYSGSLVLQMPIAERTQVRLRPRSDGRVRVHSSGCGSAQTATVEMDFRDLVGGSKGEPYARARERLSATPGGGWAAYVIGCFLVLHRERALPLDGAEIEIKSAVPVGKGVSSSAALEVATMTAIGRAWRLRFAATELPILAQQVENRVVGAPCGLMDQLASYLGRKNRLLPIWCQPDRVGEPLAIPRGVALLGIDSGVRHAVSGASYSSVRCAAFMGYSLIARRLGVSRVALAAARQSGRWAGLPFGGYLANLTPSQYRQAFQAHLPMKMTGAQFRKRVGTTLDPITTPQAGRRYAVEACTAHPVHECARVQAFRLHVQALNRLSAGAAARVARAELLQAMGELMFQSHASYAACGLTEPATDRLVEAVREAGPRVGLYGAKITGGGSGGTVCVLCDGAGGTRAARQLAVQIGRELGRRLTCFSGSSEGARYSP